MKAADKAAALLDMAKVRALGRRIPVAVRINLNNRCHSRCRYCSFWSTPSEELATGEWRAVIADLGRLGTRRLSLSGGEPTLRKDLAEIVQAAVGQGIATELNSSGFLFAERKDALRPLELVKLSLDGSEPVHDRIRGRAGAFRELTSGIRVLEELGVKFSFAFTMTRENLDDIPFALDFARRHDTFVAFQPVMATEHSAEQVRQELFPDPADYRRAIQVLVKAKVRDPARLRNSLGGLRHIAAWPNISGLACWAGEAFAMIEANGDVVPCDRIRYDAPIPNVRTHGVARALAELPGYECAGCGFCGSVELNMLMAGRVDIVPSIARVIRAR
ncbi:MAG: radical SAM protein [Polyangiaceae bacterium]|nr:radical SAM protein [Polyangiaceae bacterium]MCE7894706.1 radical SAM protein [Sorangiineae bacterium PRO1]MCL4749076.1 radical SAM protein [Myxococcales bacterium]